MEIARERFLDQTRDYHLTIGVRSRTTPMHSALTALTADERDQVARVLARAMDDIADLLRPHVTAASPAE